MEKDGARWEGTYDSVIAYQVWVNLRLIGEYVERRSHNCLNQPPLTS